MRSALTAVSLAAAALAAPQPAIADPGTEPPARFEDAVCPGVVGLETTAAEYLVGRIRQNAGALGRRMAPPETCEPNLLVAFVDDGRRMLQTLDRSNASAFAELTPGERRQLLSQDGPVHVVSRVW